MTLIGSWRFYGGASLAAVVLLCFALYFSWTASEIPVIQAATSTQIEHGAKGHPLNASHLALPAEEVEDGAKAPVNADLLTALLLAFTFGASVGWPLATGRRRQAFSRSGVDRRSSFAAGEDSALLGVFRL